MEENLMNSQQFSHQPNMNQILKNTTEYSEDQKYETKQGGRI